jgi:hypothetical protein
MKKFIHNYLNENYYLDFDLSQIGISSWAIYPIYTKGVNVREIEYGDKLVKDLTTIFGVSKEAIKNEIIIWANKDLLWYWEQKKSPFEDVAFPIVRRVFAQTLGQDLVSVQPMSAPNLNLGYLDFVYGTKKPWYEKVWNKIKYFFIPKPKKSLPDLKRKDVWMNQYSKFNGRINRLNE